MLNRIGEYIKDSLNKKEDKKKGIDNGFNLKLSIHLNMMDTARYNSVIITVF